MVSDIDVMESGQARPQLKAVIQELIERQSLELPLLPEVATRLLGMCNDPDCPAGELAGTIRRDQSIATHVLRIANSAIYSGTVRIVSIQQAVARLGIERLRDIIMVITCKERVFDVKGYEAEVRESFRHSLAAAAFAQEVARSLRRNVEEAFLCGLLHDIGRPILLQAITDLQTKSKTELFQRSEVLQAVEGFRIGVGSMLIQTWGLPNRVAEAVESQLVGARNGASKDAQVLNLAIDLAAWLLSPDSTDIDQIRTHPTIEQLNLYPEQLASILRQQETILTWVETTA